MASPVEGSAVVGQAMQPGTKAKRDPAVEKALEILRRQKQLFYVVIDGSSCFWDGEGKMYKVNDMTNALLASEQRMKIQFRELNGMCTYSVTLKGN
ncbi:MAG: hypothetical protein H7A36_04540 [Chlamydiales bacterium]|nr:hypothetical protein [Chlamydiales bacterium]